MPWHSNDPLEEMRRKLAEKERQLAAQKARLLEELQQSNEPPPVEVKAPEPPVWRLEEDVMSRRLADSRSSRKRNLARQRQRDMMVLIILAMVLLVIVSIALWMAYVRDSSPGV